MFLPYISQCAFLTDKKRGCGEKGTLLHCWWECRLVQPLWRTVWKLLKRLKTELPYDPTIPFLGIYLEKTLIQKYIHANVHCSTIYNSGTWNRTWKQPKCPSTQDWIKKTWYICTMEYYSAIKKSKIMPFAAMWMDLEIVILSEVSQTQKDKYHMISFICGI